MLIEDRGRQGLWRLALTDAMPKQVAAGGTLGGFAVSRDGKRIAFDRASCRTRQRCSRSAPTAATRCRWSRRIARCSSHAAIGATREFTVKGWGGDPVQVWVTYPPNFDPKKKWPLLHSIHGGPHAAHVDGWHYRWNTQVFAAHGYVVVGVNYHGFAPYHEPSPPAQRRAVPCAAACPSPPCC